MVRQFVQVKLSSKSDKLYTYQNDEPMDVSAGDSVEIELPTGDRRLVVAEAVSPVRPPSVPETISLKPCYKGS